MADETLALSTRLDRDKLFSVKRDVAADGAQRILDPLREAKPEVLLASVAVAYAACSMRYALGPEELFQLGKRILTSHSVGNRTANSQLDALQDFADLRIRNDPLI